METKNQGTDHQVANIRETGDGGVDRCVFTPVLNYAVYHAEFLIIRWGSSRDVVMD